jgi:predicted SAM-dependent methyltransferase
MLINTKSTLEKFYHKMVTPSLSKSLDSLMPGDLYKLNAGCGDQIKNGWLNADQIFPSPIHLNLIKDWKVSEKLTHIYLEMVIAQFSRPELAIMLRSCFMALKSKGKLRITTLNLSEIASAYVSGNNVAFDMLKRNKEMKYLAEFPVDLLFHAICMHRGFESKYPLGSFCHDFQTIEVILKSVGFKNIKQTQVGESEDNTFVNIESRNNSIEIRMQLCIEAEK